MEQHIATLDAKWPLFAAPDIATWNPSDKNANITLTNGNRTATGTGAAGYQSARGTISKSAGKWYFETVFTTGPYDSGVGVATASQSLTTWIGSGVASVAYYADGSVYSNGKLATVATFTTGDVIGVLLDLDAATVTFRKNNVDQYTKTSLPAGTWFPAMTVQNAGAGVANFASSHLSYGLPSGYSAFGVAGDVDSDWSSVSSLLLLDGANGGTTFTDSKLGATITATGSPILSTGQSKFGGTSLYLDGSSYITIPNTSGNHTFAGDFTVEFWMYSSASSGYWLAGIHTTGANDAGRWGLLTRGTEDRMHFEYYLAGNQSQYPSVIAVNNSAWHHIALVRSGTTLYLWIDGVQAFSITLSHTFGADAKNLNIGYSPFDTSYFTGYIDCLRVTKGVARYTSAFTPPASPFPAR
jgi:hypothetical protein